MRIASKNFYFLLPVFALGIFTNVGKSIDDIRRAFTRGWPEKLEQLPEWNKPLGGERWGLPPPVVAGVELLREAGAIDFRYAGRFHAEFEQRLLEGAYPMVPSQSSKWRLLFAGEPLDDCRLTNRKVGAAGEVQLATCP